MGIFERIQSAIRAFVIGRGAVSQTEVLWGHDPELYSPAEYGTYITTSNAVYACATLRSSLLGSLVARAYRVYSRTEREEVTSGPLVDLLRRVNPFWTFQRLIEMTELTLCVWGQAFWVLEWGGGRMPREIWWARPDRMRVVPDPQKYLRGFIYLPQDGGEPIWFDANEVIWLRYPNPLDEFAPLSPLAAARLAADYASAAMKSNLNLFRNGIQAGGLVTPRSGITFTQEQAERLMEALERRFKGADRAHRWGVLRADVEVHELGITPHDAEFIDGLNWSLEDIARAYRVPLDLVGGQRTYENVRAAMRAIWVNCLVPEARFIGGELTEQLLPHFPGQADEIELDTSEVEVLQEDKTERWQRAQAQISLGAITVNEWRMSEGLPPVPWGDVWWAPMNLAPVRGGVMTVDTNQLADAIGGGPREDITRLLTASLQRGIEYGGAEHQRIWNRFVRRSDGHEREVTRVVQELFARQRDSILDRLRARGQRGPEEALLEPFDRAQWVRQFRQAIRPVLKTIVETAGADALDDLGLTMPFVVNAPEVIRFIERRAQRFAIQVNETTWSLLRSSLSEGIQAGETIPQLEQRVEEIMAERIRSTPETIARTEVIGAMNGGTLEAWRQSGVVRQKTWVAALDARTRDSHVQAHGQTVGLDEDFIVGNGRGPAPGQIGLPEEDINCRCTMVAVVEQEERHVLSASISGNGRH